MKKVRSKDSRRLFTGLCCLALFCMLFMPACSKKVDPGVSSVKVKQTDPLVLEARTNDGNMLVFDSEAKMDQQDYCYDVSLKTRELTAEEREKLFPGIALSEIPETPGTFRDVPTAFFHPKTKEFCYIHAKADFDVSDGYAKSTKIIMGKQYMGTMCEISEGKRSLVYGVPVNAWIRSDQVMDGEKELTSTWCQAVFYLNDWYVWVETSGWEEPEKIARIAAADVFRLISNGTEQFDLVWKPSE